MPELDFKLEGIDKLFASMQRAVDELGTEGKKALSWGGGMLCVSLRAATKKAPEKRELITWQADGRKQYGMYTWWGGRKHRQEINNLRKNVVPFKSHTTGQMLARDKWTDEVHKIERFQNDIATMADHPALLIKKSGLAKKAWAIARGVLIASAYGDEVRTKSPVASVSWSGGIDNPRVTITNNLDYAVAAMKNGERSIDESIEKAGRQLERRIESELKKRGLIE